MALRDNQVAGEAIMPFQELVGATLHRQGALANTRAVGEEAEAVAVAVAVATETNREAVAVTLPPAHPTQVGAVVVAVGLRVPLVATEGCLDQQLTYRVPVVVEAVVPVPIAQQLEPALGTQTPTATSTFPTKLNRTDALVSSCDILPTTRYRRVLQGVLRNWGPSSQVDIALRCNLC